MQCYTLANGGPACQGDRFTHERSEKGLDAGIVCLLVLSWFAARKLVRRIFA